MVGLIHCGSNSILAPLGVGKESLEKWLKLHIFFFIYKMGLLRGFRIIKVGPDLGKEYMDPGPACHHCPAPQHVT